MANGAAAKAPSAKPRGESIFARFTKFIRESYHETFKKSSWPTKTELRSFTIVVIFTLLVVAAYIAVIDAVLSRITRLIGG